MSTEVLAATPFSDFLVPGLVLLSVNGLGSLLGSFLTFTQRRFAAKAAVALGIFLIAWIVLQVYWIGLVHWLQPLYLGFGILETALGLMGLLPKTAFCLNFRGWGVSNLAFLGLTPQAIFWSPLNGGLSRPTERRRRVRE